MKYYEYDENGFFVAENGADESPLEPGVFLIPAQSTLVIPPPSQQNTVQRWTGDSWEYVTDLRGTEYWLDDKLHTITEIGLELPEGASLNKPQSVISAEFEQHKQAARVEINRMRDTRICAGVEFPADSGVMFDSDDAAQKNINGAVTMCMIAQSSGTAFEQDWIAQDNRVITLDAAGVIGLGVTVGKHVGLHKLQANTYKNRIDTATDTDAVQFFVDEYATLS